MTREEHIKNDELEIIEKLKDVNLDKEYSPEEVVEILKNNDLDNGILRYRPTNSVTGHEIVKQILCIATIIGDAIEKNTNNLYDS